MAEEDIDIDIDIDIDGDDSELEKPRTIANTAHNSISYPQLRASEGSETDGEPTETQTERAKVDNTEPKTLNTDSDHSPEGLEIESSLADDFQIPDWVSQEYHAQAGFDTAGEMDEKSRSMIQSMLAEEEFYSGRPSKSSDAYSPKYADSSSSSWNKHSPTGTSKGKHQETKKRKSSDDWSGKSKRTASEDARWNTKLSSVDLPSHNTRWTTEEDERLREGLRLHGHGNWKAIAAVVGTRNALQVKNHARHLVVTEKRTGASSMDEDEDIDIDIESSDEGAAARLSLARTLPPFAQKSKSRSISPFSNASSRSRLSSEFDSDSDRDLDDLDDDDEEETLESGSVRKLSTASSPALSDIHGSASDPYTNTNFNTSSSSINSTGTTGSSFKPSLKDVQYDQQPQLQKPQHFSQIYDKIPHLPKERRTVSFGAVHVAELQPDITSYDEEGGSSEDGSSEWAHPQSMDATLAPSPLSSTSFLRTTGFGHPPVRTAQHNDTLAESPVINSTTNTRQDSGLLSIGSVLPRPESDVDGEEEEGSLGTGQRKSTTMTGVSPFRKARSSVSSSRTASSVSYVGPSLTKDHSTGPMASRSYSPGSMSIAPSLTVNNSSGPQTVHRILDKDVITDEEKRVHYEFFCNKASKTPERYQRIRNTILQAWERSPSTYLTKTSVRSGLKDCGDVNAIGRVHSWLESIGAINVGMTASSPGASLARPRNGGNNSSKRRGHSEERGWSSSSSSSAPAVSRRARTAYTEVDDLDSVWVTPPLRRRRVRNEKGEWVDERELEGHVIEHNVHKDGPEGRRPSEDDDSLLTAAEFFERHGMTRDEMEEEYEQERLAAQNAKYFAATEVLPVNTRVPKNKRAQHLLRQSRGHRHDYGDSEMDGVSEGYDPFRLIPLRKYNQQYPAPFRVKVSSDAMLIMDFHSHLAETEIIGLLGGLYDEDERILFILSVFPCRSLSTSLQCEIDPVSDIEARSFFSSKGFVVVGWYHSHPTFEPTPSVRDIENQTDYQTMFRRHELGVEPFVGVIVSPFDPRNLSYLSEFQFLSVSDRFDESLNCRLPYCYMQEITRTNELSVSVFQQISDLVRYYRTYEHRVDLSQPLRKGETVTKLDKMLRSLNKYIFVDETIGRAFLSKVQELVVKGFKISLNRAAHSSASSHSLMSPLISTLGSSSSVPGKPGGSAFSSATSIYNMSGYQNYSNAGQGYVQQDSFSSDNTGGFKKPSNHTLRPVTIKQLLSVQQTQADGDFRIDNVSLGSVTLIGCVRNVNKQSTHQTFQIEDGTGTIDAKRFPSEEEDPAEIAAVDIGTYVRVVGVLKQLNSRFMLTIFSIRPIQNFDELTYHTLEVIYVHVNSTKSKSSGLGGMNMPSSASQFNNQYTHHNAGASGSADFMATKILETIRNNPGNQIGVHRDAIIRPVAAATGADPQTVGDLIESMILDGFLYTGEDENHILAMNE
ncbi:hypothetical protein BGZ52_010922 [Haplosporangium bisporale]|nr:hypothetical protein BGZ52_010922 [Haplosporangium bisporale]